MKTLACIFVSLLFPMLLRSQTADSDTSGIAAGKEDSSRTQVTRLKINSSKSDFSPFVLDKKLMFVSGRNKTVGVQYVDASNESEITDLYVCSMRTPSTFKNVDGFSSDINTKYHEGPFCLNKKGTVIYYTANDKKSSLLKIYRSEKINGKWSRPALMPFCQTGISYCHPALSPDESYMVFSTGIEKYKNGMDLYLSRYVDSSWTTPVPVRGDVNDTANQVFPFINAANVLYFSSDKTGGMGGLDIYYVSLASDSARVRPLLYPLNSAADDFGVWIDSTAGSGYFSSNRNARYKDDIYYFTQSVPDFRDAKTVTPKTSFCYSFFEESTLTSKDTVNLTYEWRFGDGKKGRGIKTRHCYTGPGNYQVELNIVDKESGEVFTSEASYPLVIEWPDQLIISCTNTAVVNSPMSISASQCYLKGYEISKIYWSFGDGKYNSGKSVTHTYARAGNYTLEAGLLAKNLSSGKTEQFRAEKR